MVNKVDILECVEEGERILWSAVLFKFIQEVLYPNTEARGR